jgi:hypothetical protein
MTPLATGCQNPSDATLTLDDAAAYDNRQKFWWTIQKDAGGARVRNEHG